MEELQNLSREHSKRYVEGKVERIQHRDGCQPAILSLRHLFTHLLWGVGAEY